MTPTRLSIREGIATALSPNVPAGRPDGFDYIKADAVLAYLDSEGVRLVHEQIGWWNEERGLHKLQGRTDPVHKYECYAKDKAVFVPIAESEGTESREGQ